jgi:hypothetical protein
MPGAASNVFPVVGWHSSIECVCVCVCALPTACDVVQDACNSNASFDLTTDQMLSAISEMERAQEVVKVSHPGHILRHLVT